MNMRITTLFLAALPVVAISATRASAQLAINWSTIDCGGGTIAAGDFTLSGSIAQPDAGATLAGGNFTLSGGFWTVNLPAVPPCRPDFNHDGSLDPDDLGDFINCYFAVPACSQADFNADASVDPDDLGDFINVYFAGCP